MKQKRIMTLKLSEANKLEKRVGEWIWDGLLFERDRIVDPVLLILPNKSGSRIRRILEDEAQ